MARKGKHLFAFIQSLTAKEVRIVRHHFGFQPGTKRYEVIFDILLKMDCEDQATFKRRLKRKFKDPGKLKKLLENLGVFKVYLYDAILEALAIYYTHGGSDLDILVRKVEIEIQREHWSNGKKLLKKAREKAEAVERFDMLLRLLEAEREMAVAVSGKHTRTLIEISEDIEAVSQQISNLEAFRKLAERIDLEQKEEHRRRGLIDIKVLQRIAEDPILESPDLARSKRAQVYRNKCLFEIFNSFRNTSQAEHVLQSSYVLFQENPELQSAMIGQYIELLPRLILTSYLMKKHAFAKDLMQEFEKLAMRTAPEKILDKLLRTQLTVAYGYGDTRLGVQALIDVERRYEDISSFAQPESEIATLYAAFRLALKLQDLIVAKEWAKKIIYTKHRDARIDFQIITRVLHLVVLFEAQEWELLEYYGPDHRKFIERQAKLYSQEKMLIRFLQKASDHAFLRTMLPALKSLKTGINDLSCSKEEQLALQYFDVLQWIETQIQRYSNPTL